MSLMIFSGSSVFGLSFDKNRQIAQASGRFAHHRTLGAILPATAAEQRDDAALRIELARRANQVFQRIVGVRVIDDHKKRLTQIDALESPGNAFQIANARLDDFVRKPQRLRRANRCKNVVDVDAPNQRRRNLHFAFRRLRRERQTGKRKLKFLRGDVCAPIPDRT